MSQPESALPDLASLFTTLPNAEAEPGIHFSARPIPGFTAHRLAKSAAGEPALLLTVSGASSGSSPIVLEHLRVLHDALCRITEAGGDAHSESFTVVTCTSADAALQRHFLEVGGSLLVALGQAPTRADVTQSIQRLVELFQALAAPARTSVQGLWGELFVIARSSSPADLVRSWRLTSEDRYDFNAGAQRVEVKTTAGPLRAHHFSLEQLHPPAGVAVVIASLFVEPAAGGISLGEIVDQVRGTIAGDADLLLHFETAAHAALGRGWAAGLVERFDWERARDTLLFFSAGDVPSVNPDVALGVSQVHFVADLTNAPRRTQSSLRAAGGLFRGVG